MTTGGQSIFKNALCGGWYVSYGSGTCTERKKIDPAYSVHHRRGIVNNYRL